MNQHCAQSLTNNMPSRLYPILEEKNQHPRDTHIRFEEEGHKYTVLTDPHTTYTSVTTLIHQQFPVFDADAILRNMMRGPNWKKGHKYWGMTAEQIKKQWSTAGDASSGAGTTLHYEIECFMNSRDFDITEATYTHDDLWQNYLERRSEGQTVEGMGIRDAPEWKFFLTYVQNFPDFEPYRTEWLIYHEEWRLAGSIDMVYRNPDGSLMIYDWKRSKGITKKTPFSKFAVTPCLSHLPDTNYWHYSLQLNLYKAVLQDKYGKQVTRLCLVRLHPDAEEETYELLEVPDLQKEVHELMAQRVREGAQGATDTAAETI